MAVKSKSKKLRKVILGGLVVSLVLLGVVLVGISFAFDKTSERLMTAKEELSRGNKGKAYDIYFSIISSDSSCEEAFRALAKLAEEKVNYKDSAYFWLMISNLNPLDIDAKRNYFRAMIVSGADSILQMRFESLEDKSFLTDPYIYAVAKSYARLGKRQNIADLQKYIKSQSYKKMLTAVSYISSRQYSSAQSEFTSALADAKTDSEKFDSMFGLATCHLFNNDILSAKDTLAKIKSDDVLIACDIVFLQASIADLEGDAKTAVDKYYELSKFKRYLIAPIIQGVEIASFAKDLDSLAKFKKLFDAKDKTSLELLYYISAHECFVKGDWQQTREKLGAAGVFAQGMSGRILDLKCISKLKAYASASMIASNLARSANQIADSDKAEIVKILCEILNENKTDDALLNALLMISPENPFANLLDMHRKFQKHDFHSAYSSAKIVLGKLGYSASAFNIACASAMALGDYDDAFLIIDTRLKSNPTDATALLFAGRVNLVKKDIEKATESYMQAVKASPNESAICAEAGNFMLDNKLFDAFFKVLTVIESSKQKDNAILALLLKSKHAKINGKKAERLNLLKKAYEMDRESESLLSELMIGYVESGKFKDAVDVAEKFLQKKDSAVLRFRLASLIRDGGKDYCTQSIKLLQKLTEEYPAEPNIFLELSKSYVSAEMYTEALSCARKSVSLAPESLSALTNLGKVLSTGGLYEEALATLERILQRRSSKDIEDTLVDVSVKISKQNDIPISRRISLLKRALKLRADDESILREISRLEKMLKK